MIASGRGAAPAGMDPDRQQQRPGAALTGDVLLPSRRAVKERRQEERRLRRDAILAAAKRVYSAKGFLGATIEDIAAEARVSVGTIYLYYKSKEDLYVSLLVESMEAFTRALTKILRSRRRPDARAHPPGDGRRPRGRLDPR